MDPQTVGQELNVGALLTGTVMQRGKALSIGAELVDATRGWRLWGEHRNRKFTDIFAIQDEISKEIAEELRLHLAREVQESLVKRYTANPEAYRDYLRGRYQANKMTEDGLKKGIAYFERALQQDAHFALPYAGISDCYSLFAFLGTSPSREVMPKAAQAARKALEIDESLAEAHASLAGILKSYRWDWSGTETEYLKALDLGPNYATAHRWYADFLASVKRSEEAVREMSRALDLDPLSLIINMELAWIFYMDCEYDRAIEQALKTIEMEPQFPAAYHVLGLANEQMGRYEEAIRAFRKAREASGENPISLAALGHVYARSGRKQEARKIVSLLREQAKRGYVPPYALAIVYAAMGQKPHMAPESLRSA